MLKDKKVVLFGGSGFVGREVQKQLCVLGAKVIVVSHKKKTNFGIFEHIVVDYNDKIAIKQTLEGCDYVVNLVGILFEKGNSTFDALHHQWPRLLGGLATEHSIKRFIHISAIGADENAHSLYAKTKGLGELALKETFPNAIVLRPSVIFGPEDNFFNFFSKISTLSPFLPAFGGGLTRFQPVFVGDVAKAVINALNNLDTNGQIYELGGPKIYSFKELLQFILNTKKRKRFLLPIPFCMGKTMGRFLQQLPIPPFTHDQIILLESDNIVNEKMMNFKDLEIKPESLELIVPSYI